MTNTTERPPSGAERPPRAENAHGMTVALDVTHSPGALYAGSPLCLEAQAAAMGWGSDRISDVRFGGWPTIRADYTCPECREQARA